LVRLSEQAGLPCTLAEKERLTTINQFNISGRYDDINLALHKKANAKFTKHYLDLTKTHYLWLKKTLPKKVTNEVKSYLQLLKNDRIESVGFIPEDFIDESPLVWEIKKVFN
jgi:hypothetical protein